MLPTPLSLLTAFLLSFPAAPDGSQGATLCDGCVGTGGSSSASGGACPGAMVSVSVTVTSGSCAWMYDSPSALAECHQRRPCEVTVERAWSGLPTASPLELCLTLAPQGQTLCIGKPPPNSGSGSGSDVRTGPSMDCSGGSRTYSISSAACALSASASATCTSCVASESEH